MRLAIDSITGQGVLDGFAAHPEAEIVMGYDDGNWPDASVLAQMFPGKLVIRITTNPNDNEGDMLDVESGDATPQDAPSWTVRRRQAGHGGPLTYFPDSWRSEVIAAYTQASVPLPGLFPAAYPGRGAVLQQPTDVGHQYADPGDYDLSVVIDYLPGIDPAPTPPKEVSVPVSAVFHWNGQNHTLQVSGGVLWHKWALFLPTQGNEDLVKAVGKTATFPDQTPQFSIVNSQLCITVEDDTHHEWCFVQVANSGSWIGEALS